VRGREYYAISATGSHWHAHRNVIVCAPVHRRFLTMMSSACFRLILCAVLCASRIICRAAISQSCIARSASRSACNTFCMAWADSDSDCGLLFFMRETNAEVPDIGIIHRKVLLLIFLPGQSTMSTTTKSRLVPNHRFRINDGCQLTNSLLYMAYPTPVLL